MDPFVDFIPFLVSMLFVICYVRVIAYRGAIYIMVQPMRFTLPLRCLNNPDSYVPLSSHLNYPPNSHFFPSRQLNQNSNRMRDPPIPESHDLPGSGHVTTLPERSRNPSSGSQRHRQSSGNGETQPRRSTLHTRNTSGGHTASSRHSSGQSSDKARRHSEQPRSNGGGVHPNSILRRSGMRESVVLEKDHGTASETTSGTLPALDPLHLSQYFFPFQFLFLSLTC